MNASAWKLVKIARSLAKHDPLIAYELERGTRRLCAAINPEARGFERGVDSMVTVLKSLKGELEDALKKLSVDPDAAEFAKFFDDQASAEEEELRRLLKQVRAASSQVAGPKDWLKKMFRGKKPSDDESKSTYNMDESAMDEFVEGGREWKDPGHYVGDEAKENNEFFGGVKKALADMLSVRKQPSKGAVQSLVKLVDGLIKSGQKLSGGAREHLNAPDGEDDIGSIHDTVKDFVGEKDLSSKAVQFADRIRDSKDDPSKLKAVLKEMFQSLGPSAVASRVSVLVRLAHSSPDLRPALLPFIKSGLVKRA